MVRKLACALAVLAVLVCWVVIWTVWPVQAGQESSGWSCDQIAAPHHALYRCSNGATTCFMTSGGGVSCL